MQPFPHRYAVNAHAGGDAGNVTVRAAGLPDLATNAPAEYDGPGDVWSPETLLMAAVADCYLLGFRAIARASKLAWHTVDCDVEGTLDKVERTVRFTEVRIRARATIPLESQSRAERILRKAEETCLITNSLAATVDFAFEIDVQG